MQQVLFPYIAVSFPESRVLSLSLSLSLCLSVSLSRDSPYPLLPDTGLEPSGNTRRTVRCGGETVVV